MSLIARKFSHTSQGGRRATVRSGFYFIRWWLSAPILRLEFHDSHIHIFDIARSVPSSHGIRLVFTWWKKKWRCQRRSNIYFWKYIFADIQNENVVDTGERSNTCGSDAKPTWKMSEWMESVVTSNAICDIPSL